MSSDHRRTAFKTHGEECDVCGTAENLHVHHIDRDRSNNSPENLRVLCEEHHWDQHRDEFAERVSGPQTSRHSGEDQDGRGRPAVADHDLSPAQEALLELLVEGRITAPYAADKLGYSLQYCREQLTDLVKHDHVHKVYDGLYELVDDPREADDP